MNAYLITGANGSVGRRLCEKLAEMGYKVRAAIRSSRPVQNTLANIEFLSVGDIGPSTDWSAALTGIDVVIHLAARVHVMKDSSKDPLSEYRSVNVEGTRSLALAAVQAGVRRIVYVSTIKVNGEFNTDRPFREDDVPSPRDPYALSKWETEEALTNISNQSGLDVVIIRSPLVYGPGVKGNLLRLMHCIYRGYPLPFGDIHNSRSLISLDNLVDILFLSSFRTECAGRTFLVSDGEDLSTSDIIKLIAVSMDKKPHLINIPEKTFVFIGSRVPALRSIIGRLTGSLIIDSTRFRLATGWVPPQTVNAGIEAMVSEYLRRK